MKKILSLIMTAALAASLSACGSTTASSDAAAASPEKETAAAKGIKMTMGTGGTSGTYYAFGGVLAQYIKNEAGIDVTVVSTDGSKAKDF